jgi:hypothetical protein
MKLKPIYYRFAYSPTTGEVSLSHNHEGHPAEITFHSQMAEQRPEADLVFGYAYRLDNGWKVTNEKHGPETDVHIRVAVEKAIEHREHPPAENHHEARWEDDGGYSQRTRYGKPIERFYESRSTDHNDGPYRPDSSVSD